MSFWCFDDAGLLRDIDDACAVGSPPAFEPLASEVARRDCDRPSLPSDVGTSLSSMEAADRR